MNSEECSARGLDCSQTFVDHKPKEGNCFRIMGSAIAKGFVEVRKRLSCMEDLKYGVLRKV